MIPKVIHYCWFGGNKKSSIIKKCIKSWREKLPDYELKEWNEKNFDININSFVKNAYHNKKWAFVSDYCRLWVLYNYGGIYLDTDMEVLKSINIFLDNDSFSGTEDGEHISFGIWGCKAEDQFIKEILDYYDNLNFNDYREDLFKLAIPIVITEIANKKGFIKTINHSTYFGENIKVYPKDVFYPKKHSWEEPIITERTYTIHHYEGSWRSKKQIIRSKIKKIVMQLKNGR